ncbi:branched-chain amino acid ABC transporter ATP-binding protein/permease [soil metagenome]
MSLHTKRCFLPGVVILVLVAPLFLGRFAVSLLNDIGISALVALGLVLLTGFGGATAFGQAAFVGIAAYTSAWLSTAHGLSPWLGLPLSLLATGGAAALIGLLTLRLGGHFLPLSTIAWGLSIPLLCGNIEALGKHTGMSNIPPLQLGPWPLIDPGAIYYLIWACVGLACVLSVNLLNSRTGRAIRSLRGGPQLLASFGADALRLRMTLFVAAALLAGVAGWLYAHKNRFISPTPFDLGGSIEYVIMAVSGGLGHVAGALLGAGFVMGLRNFIQDVLQHLPRNAGQLQTIVFSALFILLIHRARGGAMGFVSGRLPRRAAPVGRDEASSVPPLARRTLPPRGSPLLQVGNLVKRFGGLTAVNDVSFDLAAGEIVGLIGPNGAGKSTLFNLITATLPKTSGTVRFMGHDIASMSLRQVTRLGIARTFQHVKLRPNMSLLDNVALGAHVRTGAGALAGALGLAKDEERRIHAEAWRQLEHIGLADQAEQSAGALPLGTQRILEIARALASDPVLLILDEPAAGLRRKEKMALARLLRRLRDDGVSILIVEHDMDFVMKLVDRLVVMNFGTRLACGLPAAVRDDPAVQAAYLGSAPEPAAPVRHDTEQAVETPC